jgi:hypothetical protein
MNETSSSAILGTSSSRITANYFSPGWMKLSQFILGFVAAQPASR